MSAYKTLSTYQPEVADNIRRIVDAELEAGDVTLMNHFYAGGYRQRLEELACEYYEKYEREQTALDDACGPSSENFYVC